MIQKPESGGGREGIASGGAAVCCSGSCIWSCLCALLDIGPIQDESVRRSCGIGVGRDGSPECRRYQCLGIQGKFGRLLADGVAHCFVEQLEGHLDSIPECSGFLRGTMGFDPPWQSLCEGARGTPRARRLRTGDGERQRQFREEVLFEQMTPQARALVRALTTAPTSVLTKIPPHLFTVVLLRRLRLPFPLSQHACRCGRPIDPFGHHRAACARVGGVGRLGFAL